MPAPANDNIASIEVITGALPITVTGNCASASLETGEVTQIYEWAQFGHFITGTNTVWYSWSCTTSADVRLFVQKSSTATTPELLNQGVVLAVYTGSGLPTATNQATPFRRNSEDYDGNDQARVYFPATSGQDYLFQVLGRRATSSGAGATASGGPFTLSLTTVLANAIRTNAVLLTGLNGSTAGTTINSIRETNAQHITYFPGEQSWFKWIATTDAKISFTLSGPTTSTGFPVFNFAAFAGTKSPDQAPKIFGEDYRSIGSGESYTFAFNADSGETYHICVEEEDDGYYGDNFSLSWTGVGITAAPTQSFALLVESTASSLVTSMSPNTQLSIVTGTVALNNGDRIGARLTVTNAPNMAFWKTSYIVAAGTDKQILTSTSLAVNTTTLKSTNFNEAVVVSTPGTVKELLCRQISAVTTGGTYVGELMVNGTLSGLSATVSTVGGISVNSTGALSLTRGDVIFLAGTVASGGNGNIQAAIGFYPDTAGDRMFGVYRAAYYVSMGPVYGALGDDASDYFPTQQPLDGTDRFYNHSALCPLAGTLRGLTIAKSTGSALGSGKQLSFSVNVNNTRSSVTAVIVDTGTATNDNGNAIAVTAGDLIAIEGHDISLPTGATGTSLGLRWHASLVYNVASTSKFPWMSYVDFQQEFFITPSTGRYTYASGFRGQELVNPLSTFQWNVVMTCTVESMYAYVTYPPYFTSTSTANPNDLSWSDLNQTNWGALSSLCRDSVTSTWVCTDLPAGVAN